MPQGYDTWIYEGSSNLPGGQRQRLAIARALIVDPRVLILDEATSALDPDSEAIVNANIKRIAQGCTVIVISHRLSSLVNSDAIMVLEQGALLDIGKHAELLQRSRFIAVYGASKTAISRRPCADPTGPRSFPCLLRPSISKPSAGFSPKSPRIREAPEPYEIRMTIHLLAAAVVLAIVVSLFAKVDRIVTSESGKIVATVKSNVFQALDDNSIIKSIDVKEVVRVVKGQFWPP